METHHSIEHPIVGNIVLNKRRGQRHIRVSVEQEGFVRVSMPFWVPFKAGVAFALSKQDWILKHQQSGVKTTVLEDGMQIGKEHKLMYIGIENGKPRSRIKQKDIYIYIPDQLNYKDSSVQLLVRKACERALLNESEQILPSRVGHLAKTHGYTYKSLRFKKLKRRWGSCDNARNLVFNIFLMQLPWILIDYVIIHELNHTKHMHHQEKFWRELEAILPEYKMMRKKLKTYATSILGYIATPKQNDHF